MSSGSYTFTNLIGPSKLTTYIYAFKIFFVYFSLFVIHQETHVIARHFALLIRLVVIIRLVNLQVQTCKLANLQTCKLANWPTG
jgi:hypothetical protein